MEHPLVSINQPAPGFSLPDLNAKMHALADYRGRIAIVNFWSAECSWSARVDGELLALLERWGKRVALLPVASNYNETRQMIAAALVERPLPAVLLDAEGQVAKCFGAHTTPHLFVIDPEGRLRYRGAFDNITFRQRTATRQYLEDAVEALLAGRPPEIADTAPCGCTLVMAPK